MIVTDGPFFSGCLMVFGLCFFLLFGAGITLGNWLRLDNPMWGVLIVFSVLKDTKNMIMTMISYAESAF